MGEPVPFPADAHERLTALIGKMRVEGGHTDEDVAWCVLNALGLDADGKPVVADVAPDA
jgi:hypothetical protein